MILMTSIFNLEQNISTSLFLILPCLAFTGFLATIYYSKTRQPGLRSKIYAAILTLVIFVLISELLYILSLGYFNAPVVSNIIAIIHWMGFITWIGLYCVYCFVYLCDYKYTTIKELLKGSARAKIITIFTALILIAYLALPKSSLEVVSKGFISGITEYIVLACLTIMCTCVLVATHTTCKSFPLKRRIAITLIMFVLAVMLVAQILLNGVCIYVICCSLQVFFLYFIIENPDIHLVNEIDSLKSDIDKSNRSKTDFLSNMSHEIRTPMNAIIGFSDSLLNSNTFDEAAARNDIQSIATAGTNLVDIINNILDISKIESGNDTLANRECSLTKIVSDLSSVIESRLGNSPVKLYIDMDEQIPSKIYADATKLYQVLLNITNNAVKYTEVGKIKVSMVSEKTGVDSILLHIKIADTGYGIKKEDFSKLFEKFSRLDSAVSNEIEGTGLGLVITKKFVDLMGGKIWFESEFEVGTTFFVDVPLKVVDPTPIGSVTQSNTPTRVKEFLDCTDFTALVVDDSPLNLKVSERLLKKYNFKVDTAESGKDCIYKFKYGNHYDIIFLDHMMPTMDGIETIRILRRLDDYEIPPIIALTANVMNGMGEKYLAEGFDGYLPMPIDTIELDKILHKFFDGKTIGVVGDRKKYVSENSEVKAEAPVQEPVQVKEEVPEVKTETPAEKPVQVKEEVPEVKTETPAEKPVEVKEEVPEVKTETPAEKPVEVKEEVPEVKTETPAEKPAEVKEEVPEVKTETPAEKPAEVKEEVPEVKTETPVEKPAEVKEEVPEVKTETPVEKPAEVKEEVPEVKTETPAEKPAEVKEEVPEVKTEAPVEKPVEVKEEVPEVKTETPVEKPVEVKEEDPEVKTEAPVEKPAEVKEEVSEVKTETPAEKPAEVKEEVPEVKTETQVQEPVEVATDKSDAAMEKFLRDNDVDMDKALELLGDMEMYNMTLGDFVADVPSKWARINQYKEEGNMHDYAIEVHSLKSDCKYLGFMRLADVSYQHELKSKEEDINFVNSNFEELTVEYNKVIKLVNEYVAKFEIVQE